MAKPLVIAKHAAPDWRVRYFDIATERSHSLTILGSPSIDDVLHEAKQSLDAAHRDWYMITKIELISAKRA